MTTLDIASTQTAPSTANMLAALLRKSAVLLSGGIAMLQSALVSLISMAYVDRVDSSLLLVIMPVALIVGLLTGILIYREGYRQFSQVVNSYVTTLQHVAQGDLRAEIQIPLLDANIREEQALMKLGATINQTLSRIRRVVIGVSNAIQRLENDTNSILEATSRQITMASEQDNVVTETTATVNEVRATVTETAERAQSVAETAQISVDISRSGIEAVSGSILGMDEIRRRVEDIADNILVLSEHTQQIGEIIAAVNNLADQSRMLALNASVEAARAGEEGKGFAVVAMEVRNLADQNRDATIQVREILGEIQRATNAAVMVTEEGSKGVDTGQTLANRAGDSIRELARAIEDAATAAMQIAASTRQQTIGMDQLTQAMRTIKHATTETVSSTMQVEGSVQRLRDAAALLNEMLKDLKI